MLAVIAILPVDPTGLPRQDQLPVPGDEHRLTRCPRCDRDCWIGPREARMAEDGTVIVEAHEAVFSAGTAFHIRVTDPAGYILPETGGASASRYYIAGAAMLLAALLPALYLRKKREEACTEH